MLGSIFKSIKNILAPKKCYSCGKEGHFLCSSCFYKQDNFQGFCYICKKISPDFSFHKKCIIENKLLSGKNFNNSKIYFKKVIVLSHYNNKLIKKLITSFKFFGKKDIGEEFGFRMGRLLKENTNIKQRDNFIILPVPMNFFRKLFRGYNQSDILAKNVAKETGICYNKDIIKRSRHTRQQAKLSQEQRLENLNNAFKIVEKQRDKVDKKIIILVDDVISTGTTVNEITKLLKQNGAQDVIVLCLASN